MTRDQLIAVIRDKMAAIPSSLIGAYADGLPVSVKYAATNFTDLFHLGRKFSDQLIQANISVPYELYSIIEERRVEEAKQSTKGVLSTEGVQ